MENNNQAMRSFDGYAGKELIVNLTKKIISARYIQKKRCIGIDLMASSISIHYITS